MPPSKALSARIRNAANARNYTKRNISKLKIRFVLACLISGLTFTQILKFYSTLAMNCPIEQPGKFYRLQKAICPLIISSGRQNLLQYQKKTKPGNGYFN